MDHTEDKAPGPSKGRVVVPAEGSALRRLAGDDSSRKRFLRMVGGAGAAGAFTLLLAACGDDEDEEGGGATTEETDTSAAAGRDVDLLNYALTLEYVEAAFYEAVLSSEIEPPSQEVAEIVQTFGDQEHSHVDALIATIEQMGGTPADEPATDFQSVLEGGAREVLATAARIENVGAAAYLDVVPQIRSDEVLVAALSIHSVEARHAAALNDIAGIGFTGDDQFEGSIPDGAFATPADRETVMQEIEPFLAGGG